MAPVCNRRSRVRDRLQANLSIWSRGVVSQYATHLHFYNAMYLS